MPPRMIRLYSLLQLVFFCFFWKISGLEHDDDGDDGDDNRTALSGVYCVCVSTGLPHIHLCLRNILERVLRTSFVSSVRGRLTLRAPGACIRGVDMDLPGDFWSHLRQG